MPGLVSLQRQPASAHPALRAGAKTLWLAAGFSLTLAGVPIGPPPARGGEAADQALKAEQLIFIGRRAEAWTAIEEAIDALWAAAPLAIRTAQIAESVEGYGRYQPRAEGPFASGERLTAYIEPAGFGWIEEGGESRVRLAVDLEIRGGQGIILAAEPDFAVIEETARSRIHELQATIEITLPTLDPGPYELRLTFRDASPKGGQATAVLPFEIGD